MQRMNPHKEDAITADTVAEGDRLRVWQPNVGGSHVTVFIASPVYTDEDGTMIVDACIKGRDEKPTTYACSVLGLTANRYSGDWTHVAIRDYAVA